MRQEPLLIVPQFPTNNHFTAEAANEWLTFYWGGTASNCIRNDAPFKMDHIYFAPTDDYEVLPGAIPHTITGLYRYNDMPDRNSYNRLAHNWMVGYRSCDIVAFSWYSRTYWGIYTEVTALRNGKDRWLMEYRSNASDEQNATGESCGNLISFFSAIDADTFCIEKLTNAYAAIESANKATALHNVVYGGVPVGCERRIYDKLLAYANEHEIPYWLMGRVANDNGNRRTLPPEFARLLAA